MIVKVAHPGDLLGEEEVLALHDREARFSGEEHRVKNNQEGKEARARRTLTACCDGIVTVLLKVPARLYLAALGQSSMRVFEEKVRGCLRPTIYVGVRVHVCVSVLLVGKGRMGIPRGTVIC